MAFLSTLSDRQTQFRQVASAAVYSRGDNDQCVQRPRSSRPTALKEDSPDLKRGFANLQRCVVLKRIWKLMKLRSWWPTRRSLRMLRRTFGHSIPPEKSLFLLVASILSKAPSVVAQSVVASAAIFSYSTNHSVVESSSQASWDIVIRTQSPLGETRKEVVQKPNQA